MGLVQACHRLSVNTAQVSGIVSGQALDDAVESFNAPDSEEGSSKVDYMNLPLQERGELGGTRNTPGSNSRAFMAMELRGLAELSDAEAKASGGDKAARAEKVVGIFLEKILVFVREHLVSRPLLMTVAAAAERERGGTGGKGGEGVQERFLFLCEVRLRFALIGTVLLLLPPLCVSLGNRAVHLVG